MSIQVETAGVFSTIQDSGRFGYRLFGVNPNGWMDSFSARVGNFLVGSDPAAASLEFHFPAPRIRFEIGAVIALTGADFAPVINGQPVSMWTALSVSADDVLGFQRPVWGSRGYLAIQTGLDVPSILGSRSTNLAANFGGFEGRRLNAGDRMPFCGASSPSAVGLSTVSPHFRFRCLVVDLRIRILPGPEFELLDETAKKTLTEGVFQISGNSDRMGFRLNGPKIESPIGSMVSSAVTFGTVQLLPDGNVIILMADHQTTGGYPRIATVIAADLPRLAQKHAGQTIEFELATFDEAESEFLRLERDLNYLKSALNLGRLLS